MLVVVVLGAAASGCSSTFSSLPPSLGGLPEGVPERRAGEFPAVHDVPPARDAATLSSKEQQQAQEELVRARETQAGRAQRAQPMPAVEPPPKRPAATGGRNAAQSAGNNQNP
jgi:hypothetical protein